MLNVLHIITTINRGGAENQLFTLVAKQIELGYKVRVAPLKGDNELLNQLELIGVDVYSNACNLNPLRQLKSLLHSLKTFRPHIIHAHLPRAELVAIFLSLFAPVISTRHNSERFFPKAPPQISKILSRFVCIVARKIIFISEEARNFAVREREVKLTSKCEVIYYGFNWGNVSNVSRKKLQRHNPFKFVTVGRLVQQKRIDIQIYAASMLHADEFKLMIYGDGELREDLREIAAQKSVTDKIEFKGRSMEIPSVLRDADCFILSSQYEGFGLVILEAIDAGLPIIASSIPTTLEILGHDYPYLFEINSPETLAKLMHTVYSNIESIVLNYESVKSKFHIDVAVQAHDLLYSKVIG